MSEQRTQLHYRNDPQFLDRYAWANSADPDQTDQGLHCLPFRLHRLHYSMVEAHSSNVRVIITHFWGVRIFKKLQ